MRNCAGCRFYDRNDRVSSDGGNLRWGRCRHSVPTLHAAPGRAFSAEGVWPQVRDDDWCGAWEQQVSEGQERNTQPAVQRRTDSLSEGTLMRTDESKPPVTPTGPRESLLVPPGVNGTSSPVTNAFASG